jgi:nitroreductase
MAAVAAVTGAVVLAAGTWMWGAAAPASAPAPAAATAGLPKPRTQGGMPLMEALKNRRSSRQFSDRALPSQVLSDLLWAAFGVNREDGRRTAPSAVNWQQIDLYVAKADGLWLFDARAHDLRLVLQKDLRAQTGTQAFVKDAAVNLVYVADYAKMPAQMAETDKAFNSACDTGCIAQNVYLFCASEGLGTVVRGLVDKPALAKAMGLRDDQRIMLAQSVGYPPAGASTNKAAGH